MITSILRRGGGRRAVRKLSLATLGILVALTGMAAVPASAEEPSDTTSGTGGWVRLAHLSPDTPSVNVALTSFANSKSMLSLADVGYGDVSHYKRVPAGSYVASMTPAGGNRSSSPAISQAVTVKDGHAYTVAAVGTNAHLTGKVLKDDLAPPKTGSAKVRLLQASTSAPVVTVTAIGGPVLARDAAFGTATGYAQVKGGSWSVKIVPTKGKDKPTMTKVALSPGSVNTLIVLDGAKGGVTAIKIEDASGMTTMPKRGMETGQGGTAVQQVDRPFRPAAAISAPSLAGAGLVLLALVALAVRSRRTVTLRRAGRHARTGG